MKNACVNMSIIGTFRLMVTLMKPLITEKIILMLCCNQLLVLMFLYSSKSYAEQPIVIRYNAPVEENDPQKDYFVLLLKEICQLYQEKGTACSLVPVSLPMVLQRQLKSLDKQLIDVVWTVTNKEREAKFLPVRIPLMKGLIGYRIAVVNNKHAPVFQKKYDLMQLKKLRLAQGRGWPDATILQNNGFNVVETAWYETLYKDTALGLFDYTLRGVLEVYSEFEKFNQNNIYIDQNLLFKYPSAMYFFVKKDNIKLANQIQRALEGLIESGRFSELLTRFKNHQQALSQAKLEQRITVELTNSSFPLQTTKQLNSKLVIQPD
ncbi:transporter substrate-binding domain-containing protein [Thalassotalea sp. 1_MG-2023]|uniref:transporter substrate-binding domain-containing protein n=1 Tax=Thalassotalea sp. 1_MG-2023 TaxID=3062680 RepID=UPI0026E40F74|nr:transporter substrate-binding domain-containing protein [Thalassotalea sp. 1_MG-2023]MDO6428598.1 transporter substrate-binding domain-containing protein [Thalassotalea sp. 1_MG-2023]